MNDEMDLKEMIEKLEYEEFQIEESDYEEIQDVFYKEDSQNEIEFTNLYNKIPQEDYIEEEFIKNDLKEENIQNENENENMVVQYEKIGLENRGYLFLKGVFSKDIIDRLNYEIQHFMNEEGIYSHLTKRQDVPQNRYYVNNTYGALKHFQQLQHYYVPVIDNRGTYNRVTDVGVIDIYNVDKLFPQIKTYFDVKLLQALLLKSTNIEWKLTRINLQMYNNVMNSNTFHVDNGNEKNIKCTIFMSDIRDELQGPPAFMEGTHVSKKTVKLSQTKTFLGERGDMLISYQNGYHRKMPMKMGGTNIYLTFHFTTKNERDRYFPIQIS